MGALHSEYSQEILAKQQHLEFLAGQSFEDDDPHKLLPIGRSRNHNGNDDGNLAFTRVQLQDGVRTGRQCGNFPREAANSGFLEHFDATESKHH